jgi:hypothetical protein
LIAEINLEMDSASSAEGLRRIISPDNKPLPAGLSIDCITVDRTLRIEIKTSRSIESLGATFEDIMNAVDLALRVDSSVQA